jgi:hypothetical protein
VELQRLLRCCCTVKSDVILPNFVFSCLICSCACCLHHSNLTGCRHPPYSEFYKGKTAKPQAVAYLGFMWIRHWVKRIPEGKAESTVLNKTIQTQKLNIFLQDFVLYFRSHIRQLPFITGGFKLYFTLDFRDHKISVSFPLHPGLVYSRFYCIRKWGYTRVGTTWHNAQVQFCKVYADFVNNSSGFEHRYNEFSSRCCFAFVHFLRHWFFITATADSP